MTAIVPTDDLTVRGIVADFIAGEVGYPEPTEGMVEQAHDLLIFLRDQGYVVIRADSWRLRSDFDVNAWGDA